MFMFSCMCPATFLFSLVIMLLRSLSFTGFTFAPLWRARTTISSYWIDTHDRFWLYNNSFLLFIFLWQDDDDSQDAPLLSHFPRDVTGDYRWDSLLPNHQQNFFFFFFFLFTSTFLMRRCAYARSNGSRPYCVSQGQSRYHHPGGGHLN